MIKLPNFIKASLLAGSILLTSSQVMAAGDYSAAPAKSSVVAAANKSISKGDFAAAYKGLSAGVKKDAKNADIHNLLGYSARKLGNYEASETHYTTALKLDPKHKGALEYMGELYLTLNKPEEAKKLLARLDDVCWLGCDEKDTLEQAIADWEAKQ